MKTNLLLAGLLAVSTSPLFCAAADSADQKTAAIFFTLHQGKTTYITAHGSFSKEEKKKRRTSKDTLAKAQAGHLKNKEEANKVATFFNTLLNKKNPICQITGKGEATIIFGNKSSYDLQFNPEYGAKSWIEAGEETYVIGTDFQPEKQKVILTLKRRIENPDATRDDNETLVQALLDKNGKELQLHTSFSQP